MQPTNYCNGLVYWNEAQIKLRNQLIDSITFNLEREMRNINRAWRFHRIEMPVIIHGSMMNFKAYDHADIFEFYSNDEKNDWKAEYCLRPETTAGSYFYANKLIEERGRKEMPLCVWQAGLSFRNEQDKTLSNVRLKQFYQLEYQFIFSDDTKAPYAEDMPIIIWNIIKNLKINCHIYPSDRLPSYSIETNDIIHNNSDMEICSISERTDFPLENTKVVEVAIGLDRLVYLLS